MSIRVICMLLAAGVIRVHAIWVISPPPKSSPDYVSFTNEGPWNPPGGNGTLADSMYTWVDIPFGSTKILPPIAMTALSSEAAQTSNEKQVKNDAAHQAQRDERIPRFNDVTADIEYGTISYKTKFNNTYSGYGISTRLCYEHQPDENSAYGARVENEYTGYSPEKFGTSAFTVAVPGNDFLMLGGFFRKYLESHFEIGFQVNGSLFFRQAKKYEIGVTPKDVSLIDWAANPQLYGIWNYSIKINSSTIGSISGYTGCFGGYTYATFCYSKNQIPYAGIASIGTTFGERVAAEADLAISHQYLIAGAQVPIYFSRLFSLTLGVKYPFLFHAAAYHNVRATVGTSMRF